MDIPNTGAVFTLGKSYLADNTQSYFYIKNDPIKRLVTGPHQSAVICESGRLFVWGENHYGQLGIGGQSSNHNKNNNSNNNSNNCDTIVKPTCVKSLKVLGLKISDIAFGNDWSVILTYSNELFFTGRNIFASDSLVSSNFTEATINDEICEIIRKPFRLEEFDNCLSHNEEAENYASILAGNNHFAMLTSFGRLIAWGSNASYQLGNSSGESFARPQEIALDASVKQFTCGPESTLVLTSNGKLYLTGHLVELVFPQFTELQKNLSSTEEIVFMHISKNSEIFIVTNSGSIYKSFESIRNKSLIFQRFYDYDSEENGPILKLLKGKSSLYCVLTKANKFYTTFSESGHHLKTFREISKFKNLRLLDIALGDQHVLAHGIPRSSTLAATMMPGLENRALPQSLIMANTTGDIKNRLNNNNSSKIQESGALEETQIVHDSDENTEANEDNLNSNFNRNNVESNMKTLAKNKSASSSDRQSPTKENKSNFNSNFVESNLKSSAKYMSASCSDRKSPTKEDNSNSNFNGNVVESNLKSSAKNKSASSSHRQSPTQQEDNLNSKFTGNIIESNLKRSAKNKSASSSDRKSPTESVISRKSINSIKEQLKNSPSKTNVLRPRTPYPDGSEGSSPHSVLSKTPRRNNSYESAMNERFIENTSPALIGSLEDIPEKETVEYAPYAPDVLLSMPTPPTEEDEELTVEIRETTDPLDSTVVVNEIRFINNGVDVTANVKKQTFESSDDSLDEMDTDHDAHTQHIGKHLETAAKSDAHAIRKQAEDFIEELEDEIEEKVDKANAKALAEIDKANATAKALTAVNVKKESYNFGDRVEIKLKEAKTSIGNAAKEAGEKVETKFNEAKESVEAAANKAADGAKGAVQSVSDNARKAATGTRNTIEKMGNNAVKAKDDTRQALGKMGNNAQDTMGTVFQEVADNMRYAVGSISSSLFHGKNNKVDVDKSTDEIEDATDHKAVSHVDRTHLTANRATPSTALEEDDERTTASVSSTSGGNPFETNNPIENNAAPFDYELDEMIQRGKQALRNELSAASVVGENHIVRPIAKEITEEKTAFTKFMDDMKEKSKGLSCRNEKSIKIEDDQPPRYTVEDELAVQPVNGHANGSKVCTIL